MIGLKDANGKWVVVTEKSLLDALLAGNFQIYGLSLESIQEFTFHYKQASGEFSYNTRWYKEIIQ